MSKRQLSTAERAVFGTCSVCGAGQGKPCIEAEATGTMARMMDGAHLGRLTEAPEEVDQEEPTMATRVAQAQAGVEFGATVIGSIEKRLRDERKAGRELTELEACFLDHADAPRREVRALVAEITAESFDLLLKVNPPELAQPLPTTMAALMPEGIATVGDALHAMVAATHQATQQELEDVAAG